MQYKWRVSYFYYTTFDINTLHNGLPAAQEISRVSLNDESLTRDNYL